MGLHTFSLWSLAALTSLAALSCSSDASRPIAGRETAAEAAPAPPAAERAAEPRIVALGDSLTAGYGIATDDSFPAALQRRVDEAGLHYRVVNAGVSGDTTSGGLSRLEWSLNGDVRILIVALGANDGLRGLPVEQMRRNLSAIIEEAQRRDIRVLLTGMEALTNMGPQYRRAFHEVFPELAGRYHVAFVPFLLEGVAGRPDLNQPDGLHPTAGGAKVIADHLWPVLEPMLKNP